MAMKTTQYKEKVTRMKFSLKKYITPTKPFLGTLFVICLGTGLLLYPQQVSSNIYSNAVYCAKILIPSLFPFIALTSYLVNSSAGMLIGRVLGFISRYVFRLPRICTTTILMGFIGGYPSGASGIAQLLENGYIDKKQATRMLYFCVNPGIAFVITFLGGTVLGSTKTGILLFVSVLSAGILLGFLSGLFVKFPTEPESVRHIGRSGALITSAFDASRGMLKMCACILLFSIFTAILKASGAMLALTTFLSGVLPFSPLQAEAFLSMALEITSGTQTGSALRVPFWFYAFGLAFGGFCVHLQVFSLFPKFPASKAKFLVFRLFHGILAACIFLIISPLFPDYISVFLSSGTEQFALGGMNMTAAGGISLALMSAVFLVLGGKDRKEITVKSPLHK